MDVDLDGGRSCVNALQLESASANLVDVTRADGYGDSVEVQGGVDVQVQVNVDVAPT